MPPLYLVLIITLGWVVGSVLYLCKTDDPTDTETKRAKYRLHRQIGIVLMIVSALGTVYILFYSSISFKASMLPPKQLEIVDKKIAFVQEQLSGLSGSFIQAVKNDAKDLKKYGFVDHSRIQTPTIEKEIKNLGEELDNLLKMKHEIIPYKDVIPLSPTRSRRY